MPISQQQQFTFGGGLNASAPSHLIGEAEVAACTNIDFSLEPGAAAVRRGAIPMFVLGVDAPVKQVFRGYNAVMADGIAPHYALANETVYRMTGPTYVGTASTYATWTPILVGSGSNIVAGFGGYRDEVYISVPTGTQNIIDNGSSTRAWVGAGPSTAPTITADTLTPLVLTTEWTIVEGTGTSTSGTATATVDATTLRCQFNAVIGTNTNLSSNGAYEIGDYGLDVLEISFSDPNVVTRVSRDYSIGGTSFQDYYHTEMDVELQDDAIASAYDLTGAQAGIDNTTADALTYEERQNLISEAGRNTRPPAIRVSAAANSFNVWAVPRPQFELISKSATNTGWANIGAARIVIEATDDVTVMVKSWDVRGANGFPLNDMNVGYAWWETYAKVNSGGTLTDESSPGPPSTRIKLQNSRAKIVCATNTVTNAGWTHRVLYRQGGYLQDAYAVETVTLTTLTYTDSFTDIKLLMDNIIMERDFMTSMPSNVYHISAPYNDRLFISNGNGNLVNWSLPGRPTNFPITSVVRVGETNDTVQGLVDWANGLTIINQDTIYELSGNFQTDEHDFILRKTSASKGTKARKTVVKTPYGVPLIDWAGIRMYTPGQGIDVPLTWANEKMKDVFGGYSDGRTARVPVLLQGYLNLSCAAYKDDKLYLAIPTGTSTLPNSVFTLDFRTQRVWGPYTYPFNIHCLYWDFADNQLLAGGDHGVIYQLEQGALDWVVTSTATASWTTRGIPWSFRTRGWAAPNDAILENLAVEQIGGTGTITAFVDNATAATLGSFSGTNRRWNIPALNGTVANHADFEFGGTKGETEYQAIYSFSFDAIIEPPRVTFFRTEHFNNNYEGDKLWDVHFADMEAIGTGSVLGTVYVDNTAIMTHTILATSGGGRDLYRKSYPSETYGDIQYTIYNASSGVVFKHWNTINFCRNEPPWVTSWQTDRQSLEENRVEAVDFDINPNGTATGTVYVDSVAVTTFTATGTKRQSFTRAIPFDTYGRTIWCLYANANTFKHYNTWYHMLPEPDRLANVQFGPVAFPSDQNLRTWVAELNPLGTATGVLYANGTALQTATFVGTRHTTFEVGLDVSEQLALQTAIDLTAYYNAVGSGAVMKHYSTKYESSPKPFGKKTWSITYRKIGGATQLDMARFYSMDIEVENAGTATVTSVWDVDGTAVMTNTLTCTGTRWRDRISFPPGIRGYLFQQRLLSDIGINVWKSNLDIAQVGIKGLSRRSLAGTPTE